jgi:hypothetical protein
LLWTEKPGLIKYTDKPGTAGGVTGIKGKASLTLGKSSMNVKVSGANFDTPVPFSGLEMFAQDPSVVVQLVNDEGVCWTTEFTPVQTKVNDPETFKAQGP